MAVIEKHQVEFDTAQELSLDLQRRWPFFEGVVYIRENEEWQVTYNDKWGDLVGDGARSEFDSFTDVIDYLDELESTKDIPDDEAYGFNDEEE